MRGFVLKVVQTSAGSKHHSEFISLTMQTLQALVALVILSYVVTHPYVPTDPAGGAPRIPYYHRRFRRQYVGDYDANTQPRFLMPHLTANTRRRQISENEGILEKGLDIMHHLSLVRPPLHNLRIPYWVPRGYPLPYLTADAPHVPVIPFVPQVHNGPKFSASLRTLNAGVPEGIEALNKQFDSFFAYNPDENKYVDIAASAKLHLSQVASLEKIKSNELIDTRKSRQNPNLSKTKTLISDNLGQIGSEISAEEGESGIVPSRVHVVKAAINDDFMYAVALIAAIGAASILSIIGIIFGWFTLYKRAKAAAEVEYPAYGVTGPSGDASLDRKLAQSAHMFNYQHQKQQIIAMERNCSDMGHGSVSDPESEEENAEGDYTVYECPGLATTGDMEVRNPMFNETPTAGNHILAIEANPNTE